MDHHTVKLFNELYVLVHGESTVLIGGDRTYGPHSVMLDYACGATAKPGFRFPAKSEGALDGNSVKRIAVLPSPRAFSSGLHEVLEFLISS